MPEIPSNYLQTILLYLKTLLLQNSQDIPPKSTTEESRTSQTGLLFLQMQPPTAEEHMLRTSQISIGSLTTSNNCSNDYIPIHLIVQRGREVIITAFKGRNEA